jgi:antitoxin component HigA of HigAB toxin-antitoxin module
VTEFPLVPIQNETHLKQAYAVIDDLMKYELDPKQEAYLDVLSTLTANYEDARPGKSRPSPAEMLDFLRAQHGMTQAQLASKAGISASTVSEIISGSRTCTVEQICKLAKLFNVSPVVFLPNIE